MSPDIKFWTGNKKRGQDMRYNLKEAVKADSKGGIKQHKEYQKSLFKQKYDKLKEYQFPKVDDINMNRFFCFPKFDKSFFMSLPSLAIYPVLCLQSDYEDNKWFQISQTNIAKMAGINVDTVTKGIKGLEELYLGKERFLEKDKISDGQRHFNVYRVNFIRKNDIEESRGKYFTFHKCIVESGVWAELKPRAKALYLSMRMKARIEIELYAEIEDLDIEYESSDALIFYHSDEYRNRKWDVCNRTLVELCKNVGISAVNLKPVLKQLENHRLIERIDDSKSIFKVYTKPRI